MRLKCYATLFCRISNISKNSTNLTHQPSVLISINRAFSQWDIVGAVCLERKPIISQNLSTLEQKYAKYIQKLEVEKSYLSDHEKRRIDDKRIAEKLKAGTLEDADSISKQTAQDFEDACIEEFNKYKPACRITEADEANNKHSTQRKLDSSLVFITKQKLGNDFKWALPQAVHEEGETLRQTAERALSEAATCHCKVQFMGNAPVGYYKYKYPKVVRGNGICGAKVFFFKAQLLNAKEGALTIKETDILSDHLWLTHSELEDVLQPVLCKTVQSFLYPDTLNSECGIDTSSQQQSDEDEPISSKVVSQG